MTSGSEPRSRGSEAGAGQGRGRHVVLGVSGSIAAYKAPALVRLLRRAGHEVRVVPTAAALRFIGAPALAAVSAHPVSTGLFDDPQAVEHVAVGQWAELVLVAPASADLLARLAAGRADDLLTATVLTTTAPVVLAPAMHTQMWLNPATVDNVATLRRRGLRVIDPASGPLTGADSGVGRLPEPEDVVAQVLDLLGGPAGSDAGAEGGGDLRGRHVVVSAGGTREPLDPVRFLGNCSSGRQGVALAAAAARAGARVTLVAAYVGQDVLADLPAQVGVRQVGTAVEMEAAVRQAAAQADAVVRWRHLASARVTVSTHGIYIGTGEGVMPVSYADMQEIQLTGVGEVVIAATNARGSARWKLRTQWAELILVLWAAQYMPEHPQLAGATWLPGDWMLHAAAHGYDVDVSSWPAWTQPRLRA